MARYSCSLAEVGCSGDLGVEWWGAEGVGLGVVEGVGMAAIESMEMEVE